MIKNEAIHSAFSKYIRDGLKYPVIFGRKEIIQLPSEIIGLYVGNEYKRNITRIVCREERKQYHIIMGK